jgi:hypothetical protein
MMLGSGTSPRITGFEYCPSAVWTGLEETGRNQMREMMIKIVVRFISRAFFKGNHFSKGWKDFSKYGTILL